MVEDDNRSQRKFDADLGADSTVHQAGECTTEDREASSKRLDQRGRGPLTLLRENSWQQRLGSGHYVPFALVLTLTISAWGFFFSNPGEAKIAEVKTIVAGNIGSIEHVIDNGLHLGALLALTLLTVWTLLSPWWANRNANAATPLTPRPLSKPDAPLFQQSSADGLSRNWFWILVICAVAIGGWLRTPLLDHSFWNDEEVAYRKFFHGSLNIDESGSAKRKPLSWQRTWFYNVTGNNHVLQSAGSRWTLERFGSDPSGNDEAVARALPLAAGLLTIVALAFLMWQAGAGLAAVLVAWILALHPWHLRYSVEARGYSGMLLFIVLAMVFLASALQRKSWPTWLGYGLCQVACLLCFPAAVYFVGALNLGVLIHLIRRRDLASLQRWSTVSIVGAAVFVQIMTPSFLRMIAWLESPYETPRPINLAWFIDLWSHVAAGMPISDGHQARIPPLDFEAWQEVGGVRYWLLIGALPLIVVAGCLYATIRHPLLRWPVVSALGALLLVLIHLLAKPMVFHGWYLLPLLLPFCIGLATFPSIAARWKKTAAGIAVLVVLIIFGTVAAAPINRLREYPRHPMRDAVESVRSEAPALAARHAEIITVAVGHGAGQFASYDPRVEVARTESQFEALLQESRQSGRPLFVYVVNLAAVTGELPAVSATLGNEDKFREIAYFPGVEAFWSITVFEWKESVPPTLQ